MGSLPSPCSERVFLVPVLSLSSCSLSPFLLSFPHHKEHFFPMCVFNTPLLYCFCTWLRDLPAVQHFVSSLIRIKYFILLVFVFC